MKTTKRNKIPHFRNEDEERAFWSKHDSTDYVEWSKAEEKSFPELRPTLKSISLRLPESLLQRIRTLANKMDVPYQSLMKVFLTERVEKELHSH
jgi:predicted DNA binding CopG/RHH family protein